MPVSGYKAQQEEQDCLGQETEAFVHWRVISGLPAAWVCGTGGDTVKTCMHMGYVQAQGMCAGPDQVAWMGWLLFSCSHS